MASLNVLKEKKTSNAKSCFICKKIDRKNAIIFKCHKCGRNYHNICSKITKIEGQTTEKEETKYICSTCKAVSTPKVKTTQNLSKKQKDGNKIIASTPTAGVNTVSTINKTKNMSITCNTRSELNSENTCRSTSASISQLDLTTDESRVHLEAMSNSYRNISTTMKRVSENQSIIENILPLLKYVPVMVKEMERIFEGVRELSANQKDIISQLEEIKSDQRVLVEENDYLKTKLISIEKEILEMASGTVISPTTRSTPDTPEQADNEENYTSTSTAIQDTRPAATHTYNYTETNTLALHTQHTTQIHSAGAGRGSRQTQSEDGGTLVVSGFVDCDKVGIEPVDLARVVLRALKPTLRREDVVSVSALRPSPSRRSPASASTEPATHTPEVAGSPTINRRDNGSRASGLPSLLVQLSSNEIVREILAAKRNFTAFGVGDIDLSLLDEEIIKQIRHMPIYVNEYLCQSVYKDFIGLKKVAKELGFKYVWHRGGRFLTRWREGDAPYTFKSAADLKAISESCRNGAEVSRPNKKNNNAN